MPAYAVVIPAYNAAATIAATIRSVVAQTIQPSEIVVVDDGSDDDTISVVEALDTPVRIIRQDNAGPGSATTNGFSTLDIPLIATLDADDLWLPEKIEKQLAYLARFPNTAGVFTHWRSFHDNLADAPDGVAGPGWSRTTMLIRREVVETVGPVIDPPGGRGEMIDWIARVREAGFALGMLDEVLALRRIRPGSLSYGRDETRDRGYLEVARLAMLRRQRRNAGASDD